MLARKFVNSIRVNARISKLNLRDNLTPLNDRSTSITIILMLASMSIISLVMNDGHDWRGDFAMYVSQAQSILDGSVQELYEMNVYSMDHSETVLGPYLYQFGFPLLLAPVLWLFGLDFFALKWLCSAGLILSIPLMFRLFSPHFKEVLYPWLVVAFIAFNSEYIIFCDSILSDLPFLCFSMLALLLIPVRPTVLNQLALGVVIYFSYLIRDIGIVLLPALFTFQLVRFCSDTRIGGFQKRELIPYLVFIFFFLLAAQLLPSGQENHFKALFSEVSKESVRQNLEYYLSILQQFFRIGSTSTLPLSLLLILAFIGAISVTRKAPHLVIYLILSLVIMNIWPYRQGIRFLFPLLPILILFAVKGTVLLFEAASMKRFILPSILSFAFFFQMWFNVKDIREYSLTDSNACYTTEMKQIYAFMKNELPKDRIVANYYPRILRMFTGMNAIRVSQWDFEASDAFYLQTGKAYVDPSLMERYQVVFETEHEIVLGKKEP